MKTRCRLTRHAMDQRFCSLRNSLLGAVVLAVLTLAAGCVSTPPLESPDVTLVNLRVVDMTVFETTIEARLRVSNPNPEPLMVEGAAFKLYLDGKKVGSGMTPETVEVPRLESAVLRTTVHINNANALLRLKEILEEREVGYGLRGRLYVTRPTGTVQLKIEREGHLDLETQLNGGPADLVDVPGEDSTQP